MSEQSLPETQELAELVAEVMEAFTGMSVHRVAPGDGGHGDQLCIGSVTIDGPFRSALTVGCRREFAERIAAAMLGGSTQSLADDAWRDALAEFTNVVGGNVKALISMLAGETCRLCLPTVASGGRPLSVQMPRRDLAFSCDGEIVTIDLVELAEPTQLS
jgi:CheY-specific phosphatase CheX